MELYLFIARLVYAFGDSVLDEGDFSLERFSENLVVLDSVRLETFAKEAYEEEKAKLELAFPANPGVSTEEELRILNDQISASRPRFQKLHEREDYWGIRWMPVGSGSTLGLWQALVHLYESQLTDVAFLVQNGAQTANLPTLQMADIVVGVLEEGSSALLDSYAEDGETKPEYFWFRYLSSVPDPVEYYGLRPSEGLGSRSVVQVIDDFGFLPEARYQYPENGFQRFVILPGVTSNDVVGLEFGDLQEFAIPSKRAKELMKGRLNLRSLAPGSGIYSVSRNVTENAIVDIGHSWIPFEIERLYSDLSWRDQRFRVFRQIVLDYWDMLVDEEGTILLDVFEELVRSGAPVEVNGAN